MTKRNELVYLGAVLDAARRAQNKVAGVTREQFDTDDTLQLNVGEAVTRVPDDVRAKQLRRFMPLAPPE